MQLLLFIVVLLIVNSAIWVFFDCSKLRDEFHTGVGPKQWPSHTWGALVFLMAPAFFPLYWQERQRVQKLEPRTGPPPRFVTEGLTSFAVIFGLIGFGIFGYLLWQGQLRSSTLGLAVAAAGVFGGRRTTITSQSEQVELGGAGFDQVGFVAPQSHLPEGEVGAQAPANLDQWFGPAAASSPAPNPATGHARGQDPRYTHTPPSGPATAPLPDTAAVQGNSPRGPGVASGSQVPGGQAAPHATVSNAAPADPNVPNPGVPYTPPAPGQAYAPQTVVHGQPTPANAYGNGAPGSAGHGNWGQQSPAPPGTELPQQPTPIAAPQQGHGFPGQSAPGQSAPGQSAPGHGAPLAPPEQYTGQPGAGDPRATVALTHDPPSAARHGGEPPMATGQGTEQPPSQPLFRPEIPPPPGTPRGGQRSAGSQAGGPSPNAAAPTANPYGYAAASKGGGTHPALFWMLAILVLAGLGWAGYTYVSDQELDDDLGSLPIDAASGTGQTNPELPNTGGAATPGLAGDPSSGGVDSTAEGPNEQAQAKRQAQLRAWHERYIELFSPVALTLDEIDFDGFDANRCQQLKRFVQMAMVDLPPSPDDEIDEVLRPSLSAFEQTAIACDNRDEQTWSFTLLQGKRATHTAQVMMDERYSLGGVLELELESAIGVERSPESMSGRFLQASGDGG